MGNHAGSSPVARTTSSQASYRLRRLFYASHENSSSAHSAAPPFSHRTRCAGLRWGPRFPFWQRYLFQSALLYRVFIMDLSCEYSTSSQHPKMSDLSFAFYDEQVESCSSSSIRNNPLLHGSVRARKLKSQNGHGKDQKFPCPFCGSERQSIGAKPLRTITQSIRSSYCSSVMPRRISRL